MKSSATANTSVRRGKTEATVKCTVEREKYFTSLTLYTGCFETGRYYQEGEKLPTIEKRPCEVCYCIKGFRKCVVKKCAPLIRGCTPKIPEEGNCCPTSYDCSRSLKVTRQIRQQNDEDEPDEENDSIDFFSLLFGSDDPPEETANTERIVATTLQPFKALPTTEKSFFDLIRAGLEIIDANADTIGSQINGVEPASKSNSLNETAAETTTAINNKRMESFTEKFVDATRIQTTSVTQSSYKPEAASTTIKLPEKIATSSTESTKYSSPKLETTFKTPSTSHIVVSTTKPGMKSSRALPVSFDINLKLKTNFSYLNFSKTPQMKADSTTKLKVSSTTTFSPSTETPTATTPTKKFETTTQVQKTTSKLLTSSTTRRTTERLRTTTPKVLIETTKSPPTARTTFKYVSSTTEGHHKHEVHFNAVIRPDTKIIEGDDNEAETLPNIEIIPFVAHDAIDTDKFEPYLKPYDNLEKDYFASDKEKPFRYNNKFIHHSSYDDTADYVYSSNPHERIDNGPYYFESNDNQFDAFSPPSEQDFLGKRDRRLLTTE